MEILSVSTAEIDPAATQNGNPHNGDRPSGGLVHGTAMFSGASANAQAGGSKPETEQLNLRIRADLYRQLDRVSVLLSARRGVPTNRVTVVEEALAAYFEANRTSS
jgi:hypothetical protein